ncbi:MAG: condensation domain-containing protein, partial [Verrucomicrobiota bacterium]|nr:condensation domain-containing protein [Verrucomicrobiota bacterium]
MNPNAHRGLDPTLDTPATAALSADDEEGVFVFPATPAQRRFWLLDQMRPGGNPALNMSLPLRWNGPLQFAAMQRAWREVVRRHEALRTIFTVNHGELQQLILPELEIALSYSKATDSPTELAQAEMREPFDLVAGPLVRARLIRLSPAEHLLLLTVHHIVSDGWSNGVIARDLCSFYTSLLAGTPPALPELSLQFADYAEWQTDRMANDDFAAQRTYWREQLRGEPAALDFPEMGASLGTPATGGATCSLMLSPVLVRSVNALAANANVSPFMVFLAAFQILLHRYTGELDFLVTSPSANRDRAEFQPLVGLFVNPLILRADLRGDPAVDELLRRVRGTALDAFAHQDIPFESLLDEFKA